VCCINKARDALLRPAARVADFSGPAVALGRGSFAEMQPGSEAQQFSSFSGVARFLSWA